MGTDSYKPFLHRWSVRKQQSKAEKQSGNVVPDDSSGDGLPTGNPSDAAHSAISPSTASSGELSSPPALSDAFEATDSTEPSELAESPDPQESALSMEDVEEMKAGDSVSAFLAKGVASEVKKAALRKLFRSEEFNIRDGLNDYDLDYSKPTELSSDIASSLRQWVNEKVDSTDVEGDQDLANEDVGNEEVTNEGATISSETGKSGSYKDGDESSADGDVPSVQPVDNKDIDDELNLDLAPSGIHAADFDSVPEKALLPIERKHETKSTPLKNMDNLSDDEGQNVPPESDG